MCDCNKEVTKETIEDLFKNYQKKNIDLPSKVYFNEEKRTSTLIFDDTLSKEIFTAKASKDDKFDKELGFLVAYFHFTNLGLSKKQVNEENRGLFSKDPSFLKPYLMGVFCSYSGLNLEKAEYFIARAIKRSEKHNKKSAK
jgi:hypothetical protein